MIEVSSVAPRGAADSTSEVVDVHGPVADAGHAGTRTGAAQPSALRALVAVARALSDPARVRVLRALAGGELCLCHCIVLLGLAPATVSKHLDVLHRAGLVRRRKAGRWCFFRLAGRDAPPAVRGALRWVTATLAAAPELRADRARLAHLRRADPRELAGCYKGS